MQLQQLKDVLTTWLNPQEVDASILIWRRYYQGNSATKMANFADDLAIRFGKLALTDAFKEALCDLSSTAKASVQPTTPATTASVSPKVLASESTAVKLTIKVNYPDHVMVFAYFFVHMAQAFPHSAKLVGDVLQHYPVPLVGRLQLDFVCTTAHLPDAHVTDYRDSNHLLNATPQQMRQLTNAIYGALCNEFGPVEVDKKIDSIFHKLAILYPQLNAKVLL